MINLCKINPYVDYGYGDGAGHGDGYGSGNGSGDGSGYGQSRRVDILNLKGERHELSSL